MRETWPLTHHTWSHSQPITSSHFRNCHILLFFFPLFICEGVPTQNKQNIWTTDQMSWGARQWCESKEDGFGYVSYLITWCLWHFDVQWTREDSIPAGANVSLTVYFKRRRRRKRSNKELSISLYTVHIKWQLPSPCVGLHVMPFSKHS